MTETTEFARGWAAWHEARVRATTSPLGLASLVATHWLTDADAAYDGVPGVWRQSPEGIVGSETGLGGYGVLQDGRPIDTVKGDTVVLAAGQEIEWGEKRLRYMERDGALALRLLDPDAATRTSIEDLDAFAPDEAWAIPGEFSLAEPGASHRVEAIDGHVSEDAVAGTVQLALPGGERVSLTVTGGPRGLHAVFSDGTSGDETYRFRFIDFPAPEPGQSAVTVDFNRAYLPPCAFSDFYVCPLPPAGNRLATPIRAGEKSIVRR